MIPAIAHLVESIERQWHGLNYDELAFSELAVKALGAEQLASSLTISDVVRWFTQSPRLTQQINLDGSFGEPPLTLAATSRFYVEALFWVDGTTSIHQHRFSGAFMVLSGSSIHARYRFARSQRVNAVTEIGALTLESVEHLRPGQVRPIQSGPTMIHSLFHLDRPTLSIVVRTRTDRDVGPQFEYWRPSVARVPSEDDSRLTRQLQLLRTLGRVQAPDRFIHALEMLQRADFGSALALLDAVVVGNPESWVDIVELIQAVQAKHRNIDCDLVPVFEEKRRINYLVSRRRQVHDAELRLFLAMLLNLPTQAACIEFLRGYAPERDPAALISGWMDRFSAIRPTPDKVALLYQPLIA